MRDDVIPVHTRSETVALRKDDIIYIESQLRLLIIHTIAKDYKYYGKLSDLMELLGEPFYRCHASLAINMDKLESASGCVLSMAGGHDIVLGRNKYQEARRTFLEYLRKSCEETKKCRRAPRIKD
ncbi:MAG: LytTR family transcriptional regulator [Clostridiales Family XIII bacterium]|nr:LytTR family transcriptional regulator [Clostridiales Family XIII bacterium]